MYVNLTWNFSIKFYQFAQFWIDIPFLAVKLREKRFSLQMFNALCVEHKLVQFAQ